MKLFYLIIFIGIFVIAEANAQCEEKIELPNKIRLKIEHQDFSFDDEEAKRYIFCLVLRKGLINEKGLIIESAYLASEDESKQEQFRRFLDKCNKESGQSKEDTAWNVFKCIQDQLDLIDYPPRFEDSDMKCIRETGLSKRLAWKIYRFDVSEEDERLKKFLYCVLKPKLDDLRSLKSDLFQSQKCGNGNLITDFESLWTYWKCWVQSELN